MDKRKFLTRGGIVLGCVILIVVVIAICFWRCEQPTTVMVVRHAERANSNPNDDLDPLTTDGLQRAETLAQVTERSGVSVIYVTQKLRTQQTAQPTATARGITPITINDQNIDDLINEVRSGRNRGRVILIVGHSPTVPMIVDRLGGGNVVVGNQFDNLFVLTISRWSPTRLIQATYGEPR